MKRSYRCSATSHCNQAESRGCSNYSVLRRWSVPFVEGDPDTVALLSDRGVFQDGTRLPEGKDSPRQRLDIDPGKTLVASERSPEARSLRHVVERTQGSICECCCYNGACKTCFLFR